MDTYRKKKQEGVLDNNLAVDNRVICNHRVIEKIHGLI